MNGAARSSEEGPGLPGSVPAPSLQAPGRGTPLSCVCKMRPGEGARRASPRLVKSQDLGGREAFRKCLNLPGGKKETDRTGGGSFVKRRAGNETVRDGAGARAVPPRTRVCDLRGRPPAAPDRGVRPQAAVGELRSGVGVIRSRALSGHKRTSAGEVDNQGRTQGWTQGWTQGPESEACSSGTRLQGAPKAQQS